MTLERRIESLEGKAGGGRPAPEAWFECSDGLYRQEVGGDGLTAAEVSDRDALVLRVRGLGEPL